jgi:hypothetical protein
MSSNVTCQLTCAAKFFQALLAKDLASFLVNKDVTLFMLACGALVREDESFNDLMKVTCK